MAIPMKAQIISIEIRILRVSPCEGHKVHRSSHSLQRDVSTLRPRSHDFLQQCDLADDGGVLAVDLSYHHVYQRSL